MESKTKSKHKRWAAAGLVAGLVIGGGALANAATNGGSSTPAPRIASQSVAPSVQAQAPSSPVAATPEAVAATPEASEVKDVPGTPEAAEANEAAGPNEAAEANEAPDANEPPEANDGGVDCENGIVKGTSTPCDGGPSANQDGGNESADATQK